jgi:hypothetical protein
MHDFSREGEWRRMTEGMNDDQRLAFAEVRRQRAWQCSDLEALGFWDAKVADLRQGAGWYRPEIRAAWMRGDHWK